MTLNSLNSAARKHWLRLSLITILAFGSLLIAGVIIGDHLLTESAEEEALGDATTSAKLIAQEIRLIAERLREIGGQPLDVKRPDTYTEMARVAMKAAPRIHAIWLVDTNGRLLSDSLSVDEKHEVSVSQETIRDLGREVRDRKMAELIDLERPVHGRTRGWALLGTSIPTNPHGAIAIVGLISEDELLAVAGDPPVKGRSFLALLIAGDTAALTPNRLPSHRRSTPVQIPLSGAPNWSIVAARSAGQDVLRFGLWMIGLIALGSLSLGLVRERRQSRRMAERTGELERLSAELLRANRMKSEFLANVSHELRTPLNAIVGFVDLLDDDGYGALTERQKVPVGRIAMSASRLRLLVDQILDMAKITAGRIDVRFEIIAVRPFLMNVVSELEPLIAEKGLTVEIAPSPGITRIRTDPTHLRQILFNLLGNAVKYTESGQIRMSVRKDVGAPSMTALAATGQHMIPRPGESESWLAIDVADSGIGIAPTDLERIFDEFEQVRDAAKEARENGSTGLGLAISRRLVRLLDGEITVESELGRGSTFTVWLPAGDERAPLPDMSA